MQGGAGQFQALRHDFPWELLTLCMQEQYFPCSVEWFRDSCQLVEVSGGSKSASGCAGRSKVPEVTVLGMMMDWTFQTAVGTGSPPCSSMAVQCMLTSCAHVNGVSVCLQTWQRGRSVPVEKCR